MENENKNQNIVNFAFVLAGFLAYFVTSVLLEILGDAFAVVANLRAQEIVKHGLPVGVGLITFLLLFLNRNAHVYADECVTEVRKVVWPSRKDTVAMTVVCCVMVVVAGLGFGVFDLISSQLIKMFVN